MNAIHKREDVFKGRFADQASDILMEPAEGFSLTHAKSAIEDADRVSGDHRLEGTIVAVGPSVQPFDAPQEASMTAREALGSVEVEEESAVSDTEADEMEEHLRGLGYLE